MALHTHHQRFQGDILDDRIVQAQVAAQNLVRAFKGGEVNITVRDIELEDWTGIPGSEEPRWNPGHKNVTPYPGINLIFVMCKECLEARDATGNTEEEETNG